jgi:hypothetical protein
VRKVAYKLQLPEGSLIHPVFHVSQGKEAKGGKHQVSTLPPVVHEFQVPEQVLDRKLVPRGRRTIQQVLIKWSSLPESLATWEDFESIKQRFSAAPAWGQPASFRGENVSTEEVAVTKETGSARKSNASVGRRVGVHNRKPSVRVSGPEWSGPTMYKGAGGI